MSTRLDEGALGRSERSTETQIRALLHLGQNRKRLCTLLLRGVEQTKQASERPQTVRRVATKYAAGTDCFDFRIAPSRCCSYDRIQQRDRQASCQWTSSCEIGSSAPPGRRPLCPFCVKNLPARFRSYVSYAKQGNRWDRTGGQAGQQEQISGGPSASPQRCYPSS